MLEHNHFFANCQLNLQLAKKIFFGEAFFSFGMPLGGRSDIAIFYFFIDCWREKVFGFFVSGQWGW
jgi:hypothetical protein